MVKRLMFILLLGGCGNEKHGSDNEFDGGWDTAGRSCPIALRTGQSDVESGLGGWSERDCDRQDAPSYDAGIASFDGINLIDAIPVSDRDAHEPGAGSLGCGNTAAESEGVTYTACCPPDKEDVCQTWNKPLCDCQTTPPYPGMTDCMVFAGADPATLFPSVCQ